MTNPINNIQASSQIIFHQTSSSKNTLGVPLKNSFVGFISKSIKQAYEHYEAKKYPAHEYRMGMYHPLDDLLTKQNKEVLIQVISYFFKKDWFYDWIKERNWSSKEQIINYYWSYFQKGLCAGIATSLLHTIKEGRLKNSDDIKNLPLKDIFYYHIFWDVVTDFGQMKGKEILYRDLMRELFLGGLKQELIKSQLTEEDQLSYLIEKSIYAECLIVHLSSDRGGHVFLANLSNFYFYDPISDYAGLYAFNDFSTFVKFLFSHIYNTKNLKSVSFRFI